MHVHGLIHRCVCVYICVCVSVCVFVCACVYACERVKMAGSRWEVWAEFNLFDTPGLCVYPNAHIYLHNGLILIPDFQY